MPIFIVFLNINQKLAQKGQKQNDNFSHFAQHRLLKRKNVLLQPPVWPNIGVFSTCVFWNQNIDVEQKT